MKTLERLLGHSNAERWNDEKLDYIKMKLSERTISALGKIITGDENKSRRRSGPELVKLFNEYGSNDVYEQDFPSRWKYAEDKIRTLNSNTIKPLICNVFDPRDFNNHDINEAIEYINKYLKYDGYELIIDKELAKVRDIHGISVECVNPFEGSKIDAHLFIDEQIGKAEIKIQEGDYDGAITNARSLIEAVLLEIERDIDKNHPEFDGDVTKLYKRVQKNLNLEPSAISADATSLKQVLSGLSNIVLGIAGLSNRMGDRHARTYKPEKHHAVLVVNSAKTLVNFLFETKQYQNK